MTGSSREFYGTGTNFFWYRYRYFFPGPIFSGTGTGTFFRDLIFPVPVSVLFSGTKFIRYRYRYLFPGPIFSGTGTDTIQKGAKFAGPGIPGSGMSHSDTHIPDLAEVSDTASQFPLYSLSQLHPTTHLKNFQFEGKQIQILEYATKSYKSKSKSKNMLHSPPTSASSM